MGEEKNRPRTNVELRKMVNDFLDHLRYVVRQEWNEFRSKEELVATKNRYDWFAEELWRLMLEELWRLMLHDKHATGCRCEICVRLRVEEDR